MDGTLLVKKEFVWRNENLVTEGLPNTWSVAYYELNEYEHDIKIEMTGSSQMFEVIDIVTYLTIERLFIDASEGFREHWSQYSKSPQQLSTEKDQQPNYACIWLDQLSEDWTGDVKFVFTAYMAKQSPPPFGGYDLSEKNAANDQVLVVEGQKFYVNRAVLSFFSPVFETLFNNENFDESKKEEIELKDVRANEFAVLLKLVFPTTVAVNEDNVEYVWKLADRFGISSVYQICESFLFRMEGKRLSDKLSLSNRLRLAQTNKSDMLMSAVFDAMQKIKI